MHSGKPSRPPVAVDTSAVTMGWPVSALQRCRQAACRISAVSLSGADAVTDIRGNLGIKALPMGGLPC